MIYNNMQKKCVFYSNILIEIALVATIELQNGC
jgi:hypothetical protein